MTPTRLVAALCLGALALGARAHAQDPTPDRLRHTITVVGVGRERGRPDTVDLRIAIEQNAPTAQAASQQAAKAATQVVDALRKLVGADGRVETSGYQLNPIYRTERPDPQNPKPRGPEIVSYTAVNQLAVRTSKLDSVGTLIDAAIAAGASRVDSLAFTVADPMPLQAAALRSAGIDAASQAAAIADALKVTLHGVLEASTDSVERPMPRQFSGAMMRAEAATAATPIDPGDVTTEARVRVVYAID
ncbi:MAG TPA: SIMPL domain-containing protein [Candidatus Binatia bacterium]|jgi:hypothetical protein